MSHGEGAVEPPGEFPYTRGIHRQQLETMERTEIRCRRAFYQALDRLQRTKNSPVEKSVTVADKPLTS